jgi:hypothetical protein
MKTEPQYALVLMPLESTNPQASLIEATDKFEKAATKETSSSESEASRRRRGLTTEPMVSKVITVLSESDASDDLLDKIQEVIHDELFSELPVGSQKDDPRLLKEMEKNKLTL